MLVLFGLYMDSVDAMLCCFLCSFELRSLSLGARRKSTRLNICVPQGTSLRHETLLVLLTGPKPEIGTPKPRVSQGKLLQLRGSGKKRTLNLKTKFGETTD